MLRCVTMMKMNQRVKASIATVIVAGSLFSFTVPMANAAEDAGTVTSARSFPKLNATKVDLLVESASVAADDSTSYGGVESLNVPQTKSQAEIDAEAKAKAEAEAKAQAAAQAASRASSRQSLNSNTNSNNASSNSTSRSNNGTKSSSSTTKGTASGTSNTSGTSQSTGSTSVSGNTAALIAYALQFQGVPYVIGGTTPSGWDCSGFTSYVYGHFGIGLARTTDGQRGAGTRVSDPQPGDLMWKPGHVGIYIGNGKMVHATKPGDVTKVASTNWYSGWEYYRVM